MSQIAMKWVMGDRPCPDEKQKSDDSDDEGNDLPDVGIQAPYVTQKGEQPSACDHRKGS